MRSVVAKAGKLTVMAAVAGLCSAVVVPGTAAADMKIGRSHERAVEVRARIVGWVPLEELSTIGINHESYLVEVAGPGHAGAMAPGTYLKVSYRFYQRDSRMNPEMRDYALVHRLRMVRDVSCDESWESFARRMDFDTAGHYRGTREALVLAANAPGPQALVSASSAGPLPCYAVRPADYKSSARVPVVTAEHQPGQSSSRLLAPLPDQLPLPGPDRRLARPVARPVAPGVPGAGASPGETKPVDLKAGR